MNRLYYGDCLTVMQDMPLASVDLIYLDPPFNSQRQYNSIYKDETGRPLPDQIESFCDMWELDSETEEAIRRTPILMRESGIDDTVAEFWRTWTNALRYTNPRLLAYLNYMVQRLLQMKVILKPTGSVYLHCDPTVSHYIKVMMDAIFGHANFQNEIVWSYRTGGVSKRRWPRKHDILLFYTSGKHYQHNPLQERVYYDKPFFTTQKDEQGRHYADVYVRDTWDDIKPLINVSRERMGYATQKPVALLERIITASCPTDGVVLDPFCGCATTLEAAHNLGRRWIGIDIAIHAVKRIAKLRLEERLGLVEGQDFTIEGVPHTVEGAQDLWERDKYHFQKWAVESVDGFVTTKRSADGGIDGRVYFALPGEPDLQSLVIEVKGGANVSIRDLRALRGVLDNDSALIAGLIVMQPLGHRQHLNFEQFMADAGSLEVLGVRYPRLQLLTVDEILEGKRFKTPTVAAGRHEPQPRLTGFSF